MLGILGYTQNLLMRIKKYYLDKKSCFVVVFLISEMSRQNLQFIGEHTYMYVKISICLVIFQKIHLDFLEKKVRKIRTILKILMQIHANII